MKKPHFFKLGVLILGLQFAGLFLAACDSNEIPTPTALPKDLPRNRILFLSNRDGWPDLYTLDPAGKNIQRLTQTPEAEYQASWSPDGQKVAFSELEGDQASGDYTRNHQVVVMDGDGKNRKVVASDGFGPVWSPDNSKILFLRTSPINSTPANSNPTPRKTGTPAVNPFQDLTATPLPTNAQGLPVAPGVLPTPSLGESAASGSPKLKGGLYIIPSDGSAAGNSGSQAILVADNAVEGAWSPDGKRIAFISGNNQLNSPRALYLADSDGKNNLSLSEKAKLGDLDILHLAWSPDGSSLAFTAVDSSRDRVSLYRLPVGGTIARRLADYNGSSRDLTGIVWAYSDYFNPASRLHINPVWAPNGRSIAFTEASSQINVVDAENGNRRIFPVGSAALGQDKDAVLNLSWFPDSRSIVYDRAQAGRNEMLAQANYYIYDFFGETLETLDTVNKNTTSLASETGSFLTPICCGVAYPGDSSPEALKSSSLPATTPSPVINAEGKIVFVSGVGQRQLVVQDLKTKQNTVLSTGLFKLLDFSLSPNNDRLVYLEVGEKYTASLYLSSLDGKQKRKLSEGTGDPDDLSNVVLWSPDGSKVAFQVLSGDPNLKPGLYTLNLSAADNFSSSPRLVTAAQVSGFSWSPDSQQIAFKVDADFYELWVAPAEGNPEAAQKVAQLGVVNRVFASLGKGVAWSPNGQWVALAGPSNFTRFSLWLVNPATGVTRDITTNVIGRIVGWTPDSNRLFTLVATFSQNTEIQALNLGNTSWRQYGVGMGPQLSPDGQFLAFYSSNSNQNRGGSNNLNNTLDNSNRLIILRLATGETRGIPFEFTPYYGFKARFFGWAPDGKTLAYYNNNSIFRVGPDGQNSQILARGFSIDKLSWAKG